MEKKNTRKKQRSILYPSLQWNEGNIPLSDPNSFHMFGSTHQKVLFVGFFRSVSESLLVLLNELSDPSRFWYLINPFSLHGWLCLTIQGLT